MVFATITIGALSLGVWAHHMFTTGVVLLPFFSIMSLLIAVPTGIKIFNWIGTMWGGRVRWTSAMLFAIGFVITFLIGGLTGIYLASPPLDFFTHDTYFVVAHFHSVVLALVMGGMAGVYYWGPKITGYLLNERIGKIQFWTFFIGANLMVMPQYQLGLLGMPRRVATYIQDPEWADAQPMGDGRRVPHGRSARSSSWPTSCTRGTSACRPATTPGTPRRSSGSRRRRRRTTTTTRCRRSARSARPGTTTTPRRLRSPTATTSSRSTNELVHDVKTEAKLLLGLGALLRS